MMPIGYSLILLSFLPEFHPVHVSVLNIEHVQVKNEFELSLQLQHDDLYMLGFHRYGDRSDSIAINGIIDSESFITTYLKQMLILVVNKADTLQLDHIGKREEGEQLWIHATAKVPEKIAYIHIYNYLMMDIFGDQTNLVIMQVNGKEKGVSLDAWKPEAEIVFDEEKVPEKN